MSVRIFFVILPHQYNKEVTDMERIKRTREEVRAAFREFMQRKKEHQLRARMELEVMSRQGFFDN